MQVKKLHKEFDKLQKVYGDKNLDSVYGAGCTNHPDIMFIFMNPTGRNVASSKEWTGLKAQWLGTKNIWKLFSKINLLDNDIYQKIINMKPNDWNYVFAEELYNNIMDNHIYITNLGKCTQTDAKPLPDKVLKAYLELLEKEISSINPKIIITFGNQVSSIILNEAISVSKYRKQSYGKVIKGVEYKIYPTYYPVGQGMRNIDIAISDILEIMRNNEIEQKN